MKKILPALLFVTLLFSFSRKKIHWVAIGDSITYLNDHRDETGNRITKGYMTLLARKIAGLEYTNQGHNGWTAGNIADGIEQLGLEKADLYTIFLGTNDWWQERPVGSIENYKTDSGNTTLYGSFRIIMNKLRSLNKDAVIILITPIPRVDFVYIADAKNNAFGSYKQKGQQHLEQFAEAIIEIGKFEHCRVIDLYHDRALRLSGLVKYKRVKDPQTGNYKNYKYPDFIDIPFNPATDDYPYPLDAMGMTFDGLHPSDKGYQVIADRLGPLIKKIK